MALFSNGVHPKGHKERTARESIRACPAPQAAYVPLSQHIGAPAEPVVAAGERVLRGQLLARKAEGLSANVYSPVAGIVKGVVGHIANSGKKVSHILVESDGTDESCELAPLAQITAESVLARIEEAGIVGMGGAGFPTAAKLGTDKEIAVLVVNGAECEPYITCDHRIMLEFSEELLEGVRLCMTACGAKEAVIGVESNKRDAAKRLASLADGGIRVKELKTRYPQGAEKQLVYGCTKRVIPEGGLPSDAGVLVVNVHTALAVYKAVRENTPCYERVMTVSGSKTDRPCNIWVKNGTLYRAIAEFCGAHEDCARIVSGGPMMGEPVFSLKICATKTSSSLLFLGENECQSDAAEPCIGCGRCVQACPMGLSPVFIERALFDKKYDEAEAFGAAQCIGCGCCSYVCPAKRFLMQSVKLAKKNVQARRARERERAQQNNGEGAEKTNG